MKENDNGNGKKYLLVETDFKTKCKFKAYCASRNMSLKKGIDVLMRSAVKNNKASR